MSAEPRWFSVEMAEALHALVLAQHGGGRGVRDRRRLESALQRPRNLHAYGSPTFAEMAAAYASGIIEGHPFVDGNKRTGLALAIAFLEFNGLRFRGSEAEAVVFTLGLAAGQLSEQAYADWLDANHDHPEVREASRRSTPKPKAPRRRR